LLAAIASAFQTRGLVQLHQDWLTLGLEGAAWGSKSRSSSTSFEKLFGKDIGYGDLHSILGIFDLSHLAMPTSLALLAILGVWVYFHRSCNVWLLMGVAAIVSRIWTYHRVYDDMLVIFAIFAIVTALRELPAQLGPRAVNLGRGIVAVAIFLSLIPASLRLLPTPLDLPFKFGQLALWLVMMGYLLYAAWIENCSHRSRTARSETIS
ncbi:MAG: hypothetical protein AAFY11_14465, partial [Cyanobacteria bacterium J06641_5]